MREPETLVFATKKDQLARIYRTYLRREAAAIAGLGYSLEGPVRVDPYVGFVPGRGLGLRGGGTECRLAAPSILKRIPDRGEVENEALDRSLSGYRGCVYERFGFTAWPIDLDSSGFGVDQPGEAGPTRKPLDHLLPEHARTVCLRSKFDHKNPGRPASRKPMRRRARAGPNCPVDG